MGRNATTRGVERRIYADPFGEEKFWGEGEGGDTEPIRQKGQDIFVFRLMICLITEKKTRRMKLECNAASRCFRPSDRCKAAAFATRMAEISILDFNEQISISDLSPSES
jgi:hypothetical protein